MGKECAQGEVGERREQVQGKEPTHRLKHANRNGRDYKCSDFPCMLFLFKK